MRKITDFKSKRVISEPGDRTRYDFIITLVEGRAYYIPYGNTFQYPYYLDFAYIKKIKTIEDAWKFKMNSLVDIGVNGFTILECVRATLVCLYGAIITDSEGTIHFYGSISEIHNVYRVLTADIYDISEEDEIKYGDILRNTNWVGTLKIEKNND